MLLLLENKWANVRVPSASLRGRSLPHSGVPVVQGFLLAPLVVMLDPHLGHREGLRLILLRGQLWLVVFIILMLLCLELRAAAEALDIVREESLLGTETHRVRERWRILCRKGDKNLIE